ncbi:uncharacterized protein LOC119300776 [Triticum dicoccoides]|uniref:uncharacterized protein LOC119300776 n=1 Tax=Triticum dicoccoides TaxID=85692 RepID=UPI00188DC7E9|nr:uncharacterized protein LOC119300776 [Triticum dicoccoides]XP_037433561.1 uncharacterized protein LOC119300776 [Triticum dicoccoides]
MTIRACCSQAVLGSMVLRFGSCGEFVVTLLPSEFEMNHFQSVYGEPRSSRGSRSSRCGQWSSRIKELKMVQEECLQRLHNWIEVPYDSIAKEQHVHGHCQNFHFIAVSYFQISCSSRLALTAALDRER